MSTNATLVRFSGRHSRHKVTDFLPEAWVPRGSAVGSRLPPNGGANFNQVLQTKRKMLVLIWAHLANLNQNYTHLFLDQHMVKTDLKGLPNTLKPQSETFSSKSGPILGLICYPRWSGGLWHDKMSAKSLFKGLTCQSNSASASGWDKVGLLSATSGSDVGVRMTISRLLSFMRSSTCSRWSVRLSRHYAWSVGQTQRCGIDVNTQMCEHRVITISCRSIPVLPQKAAR